MGLFRRHRDETLNEQLLREAGLDRATDAEPAQPDTEPEPPEPVDPYAGTYPADDVWGIWRRAMARPGEYDAVVSVHAPGVPGDAVEFATLPNGDVIVDTEQGDADLSPLADAVEKQLRSPYRVVARRGEDDVWSVAARGIDVLELDFAGRRRERAGSAGRPFDLREFVDSHLRSETRPHGHGFTALNVEDGIAYYVHDTQAVRFITLDTACPAGGAEGCITETQLQWLERRLEEVHSMFRSRDGTGVSTLHQDRLVVILSHHGLDTLTNPRPHGDGGAESHVDAARLLEILLRFDNVVLWLNGHIHANRVRPRPDPNGEGGGFWEVTTSSLVDWPCQGAHR